MTKKRLVVVKDVLQYNTTSLKHLLEYVKKPAKSTCLVLSIPQKTGSGKWINTLLTAGLAVDCRQLYENEIGPWIRNYVSSRKMEIEFPAIHLLIAQVGTSLLNLINEIEKVQINIHPRSKITVDDIQTITSILKQNNVFELCEAVGDKNFPKSIAILNNLLDRGEKATGIVIQLFRHFVNLLKIHESARMNKNSIQDLSAVTKVNPYFIRSLKKQVKIYEKEQLKEAFKFLTNADLQLKTSYQKQNLIMELLLYNLIKCPRM